MLKNLKSMPLLFWALPIAIVVNIVQFPSIRESGGRRAGALYQVENPDIFSYENVRRYAGFFEITNVFFELGRLSPGATIYVNEGHPFIATNNNLSYSYVLGKTKGFKQTNADSKEVANRTIARMNPNAKGDFWVSTKGRANAGPKIKWEIYLSDQTDSRELLFVYENKYSWKFVDLALLSEKDMEAVRK